MNVHLGFSDICRSYLAINLLAVADGADANGSWLQWSTWMQWLGPTSTVLLAVLLVLLCVIAWGTNLIALPGNWFSVGLLAVYAWLGPQESRAAIGVVPVLAAFACALLGEVIEFIAGALGAQRAGASRKSTLLAVVGSMVGAIFGAVIGI